MQKIIKNITLPTERDSEADVFNAFYFRKRFDTKTNSSVHKEIITVFQKIISGKVEEDVQEGEVTQFNSIDPLKNSFSIGNFKELKNNWSNPTGVKKLLQNFYLS